MNIYLKNEFTESGYPTHGDSLISPFLPILTAIIPEDYACCKRKIGTIGE